ncbi:MAG: hypothetical protein ACYDER_24935 [Ktedonobacteraceae bacterium]
MIQEPGRRPYKRANRTKNRPVLVASTEQDAMVSQEQEDATSTTDSAVAVEAQPTTSTTTGSSRRLPGFFSTVGRKQQEETTTEADIAQARIARATRGKSPAKAANTTETTTKEATAVAKSKIAGRPAARTTGGFKTRYLIGMAVYLLAANFIGVILTNAFASGGIDRLLTSFNLFGGNIQIRTSTLAYLAILVVLLIALAYFDLIPRSFSALSGQKQPVKRGTSTKQNTSDNVLVRNTPPPMRQGIKGADDDLYEEYRFNQRRSKKK